jgi:flagellar basal-body rod modification protein FlgD
VTISSTSFTPFTSFSTGYAASANSTSSASSSATAGAAATGSASPNGATNVDGTDTLAQTGASSMYGLTTDDFMKLFLAQLQNQDPTKPVDDQQMLSQLSQMSQIQTLQNVQKALAGSQLAQSSALIGKNVTGLDVNGTKVDGVVTSVTQSTDAGLVLQVGTQYIKPDAVIKVTTPTGTSA